jgi:hypothetical protein
MNSWNGSTSYAVNLKIHKVIPSNLQIKVFEMMECDGFYDEINFMCKQFDIKHGYKYQAGFNGRSGGYLVLYQGGKHENGKSFSQPGLSFDQDEDFENFDLSELNQGFKLVSEFDQLAQNIINHVVEMAQTMEVKTKRIKVLKEIKVLTNKL